MQFECVHTYKFWVIHKSYALCSTLSYKKRLLTGMNRLFIMHSAKLKEDWKSCFVVFCIRNWLRQEQKHYLGFAHNMQLQKAMKDIVCFNRFSHPYITKIVLPIAKPIYFNEQSKSNTCVSKFRFSE